LRELRCLLAPGDRQPRGRLRPAGKDRHDQAGRRLAPAHLQRAPAVHLYRRLGSRPGLRQQPQPERRTLARGARLPVTANRREAPTTWLTTSPAMVTLTSRAHATPPGAAARRRAWCPSRA